MGKEPDFQTVAALAGSGLCTRKTLSKFEADFSGRCESPIDVALWAHPQTWTLVDRDKLPDATQGRLLPEVQVLNAPAREFIGVAGLNYPIGIDMQVRCRKCDACRQARARLWAEKAQAEIRAWPRTWFATFTATPQQHYLWLSQARKHRLETGRSFDAENADSEFYDICAQAGRDLTRYWKRVRKEVGGPIRYFFVAERHTDVSHGGGNFMRPHWHALIHETDVYHPIRKAVLKKHWQYGFTTFKLVENPGAAWYLCKYISKDIGTRIRASLRYGQDVLGHNEV